MNKFVVIAVLMLITAKLSFGQPGWQIQSSGVETSIRGASAVNAEVCWLGTKGKILRTGDGGQTWEAFVIAGAEQLDFRDVQAFDDQTCIAMSAGEGSNSRVYKTTDGGKNWRLVAQNDYENGFFNGIAFWDEQTGLLVGDPVHGTLYLLKTSDGGTHWTEIPAAGLPVLKEGEYGFAASGTNIATVGNQQVFIGTGGSFSRIFYSQDQGQSWAVVNTPMVSGEPSQGIFSIAFKTAQYGMAVGGDYTKEEDGTDNVIVSTNGGEKWQLASGVNLNYRSCIVFIGNIAVVAGPSGTEISYNSGKTFKPLGKQGFHTLAASPDADVIWAAGAGGVVGKLRIND